MHEIPERFWSLFRSVNRATYIEALLKINEEYEYSNYFLSREMCIQLLSSYFAQKRYVIWQDELEEEEDQLEPPATRVLNWLLKTGWLRKVDDYSTMTVNIVIPDYAAVMIEAFHRLSNEQEDETQIYIQNVYAILFSLKNDSRAGIGLLDTAIINTRKLNKSLQDLLHNMDTFFGSLLEQKDYSQLLKDHLEGYVQEVVNKKYHILKTSDNFYLYKTDIKTWIRSMREDEQWQKRMAEGMAPSMILQKLDQLERGFDDIEHRITNIDREHSRYVKATVTRLGYLLNQEDDMKGLVIQLLNRLSANNGDEDMIQAVGTIPIFNNFIYLFHTTKSHPSAHLLFTHRKQLNRFHHIITKIMIECFLYSLYLPQLLFRERFNQIFPNNLPSITNTIIKWIIQ